MMADPGPIARRKQAAEDDASDFQSEIHAQCIAVALIAAALGAGLTHAQTPTPMPMARTVKAVQPGLLDVTGPRVSEALAAGIVKIVATPGKGGNPSKSSRRGATSSSIGPRT